MVIRGNLADAQLSLRKLVFQRQLIKGEVGGRARRARSRRECRQFRRQPPEIIRISNPRGRGGIGGWQNYYRSASDQAAWLRAAYAQAALTTCCSSPAE